MARANTENVLSLPTARINRNALNEQGADNYSNVPNIADYLVQCKDVLCHDCMYCHVAI